MICCDKFDKLIIFKLYIYVKINSVNNGCVCELNVEPVERVKKMYLYMFVKLDKELYKCSFICFYLLSNLQKNQFLSPANI